MTSADQLYFSQRPEKNFRCRRAVADEICDSAPRHACLFTIVGRDGTRMTFATGEGFEPPVGDFVIAELLSKLSPMRARKRAPYSPRSVAA
jgi:hypothetical protein